MPLRASLPLALNRFVCVFISEPTAPRQVKLANVGVVKLEATWLPPSSPNGKIVGYKVSFKRGENTRIVKTISTIYCAVDCQL